ncbi:MAG: hypothetical protein EA381_15505 [Planctomycetaceae bacterium]|nr:MAG: hypothetical protein EA381_15505 [Planctomycetaceae bacterium]
MNKRSDFRRISEAAEHLGVPPNPLRNGQNAGKPSVHRHPVYVRSFDDVCTGAGRTKKKPPIKSPNLQAFVERVIQALKHEVLNGFCVVSEQHLNCILRVGADWYNHRRGHSGRDHLPPARDEEDPPVVDLAKHKLVCHTELRGNLKSYRVAA